MSNILIYATIHIIRALNSSSSFKIKDRSHTDLSLTAQQVGSWYESPWIAETPSALYKCFLQSASPQLYGSCMLYFTVRTNYAIKFITIIICKFLFASSNNIMLFLRTNKSQKRKLRAEYEATYHKCRMNTTFSKKKSIYLRYQLWRTSIKH